MTPSRGMSATNRLLYWEHCYGLLGKCSLMLWNLHHVCLKFDECAADDDHRRWLIGQSYTYARCLAKGIQLYNAGRDK